MAERTDHLRADAFRYGADTGEVDRAIAALRVPEQQVSSAVIDLGDCTVSVSHPGRGHTDHDLIAVVTGFDWSGGRRRLGRTWRSRTQCSCRATAQWSMRRSSADSRRDCSADCDEFQSPNVT